MAMTQDGPNMSVKIGYRTYNERSWRCTCDFCGKKTERSCATAGEASDAARFEGFSTVKTGLTTPLRWSCSDCQVKRIASGKASAPVPKPNGIANGHA
jgi:hypothetical protein